MRAATRPRAQAAARSPLLKDTRTNSRFALIFARGTVTIGARHSCPGSLLNRETDEKSSCHRSLEAAAIAGWAGNHSGRLARPAGRGGSADFARRLHDPLHQKHVGEKNEYETNLWVVAAEGPRGNASPEARQFTSGKRDSHGRWSPDGRKDCLPLRAGQAQVANLPDARRAGAKHTPLTRFPEGTIKAFKWSPDGRLLAVAFRETHADRTQRSRKRTAKKVGPASLPT